MATVSVMVRMIWRMMMSDQEKAKNGYYKIVGKRGQRREVRVKEQEEIQQRRHSVRNQQQQQQ